MLKIGSLKLKNRFIMAPMAGVTNLPFRLMVKELGAGLVFSEMVSAMGLVQNQKKTISYLRTHPAEKPFGVQIFGSKPDAMAMAAQVVIDSGADLVDINMGCPVKKVTKTGAGSSLLRNLKNAEKIITAVRLICNIPLTVKIRSGWSFDEKIACEAAHMIENCGADAVIIHARFTSQVFSGHADWSVIKEVKDRVNIPVIGNGDIKEPGDALRMIDETGCDGVMVAREAVKNPWIFSQILKLEKGESFEIPDLSERRALIMKHFSFLTDDLGEFKAALFMRGLLLRYTKGLPLSSFFREKITKIKDMASLVNVMDNYFKLLEERESES